MEISYNIIFIHGHDTPQLCGQRTRTSLPFWFYNSKYPYLVNEYYGGLGIASIHSVAYKILDDVNWWFNNVVPSDSWHSILLAGSSCGGVTACRTLEVLAARGYDIPYVGLADAAFVKNETEHYLSVPPKGSSQVTYKKNYYQSIQNSKERNEIHDMLYGFDNYRLNGEVDFADPHVSCCEIAKGRIINDMRWCIANDK